MSISESLQTHMEALDRYALHGIEPGSCTRAILENNLYDAVARADMETEVILGQIMRYVVNHLPMGCWGSRERVDAWIKAKREQQQKEREARNA